MMQQQGLDTIVCNHLKLVTHDPDMTEWKELVDRVKHLSKKVKIALVGKYVELQDAYISVVESMKHAGYVFDADIDIDWINAEDVNAQNVDDILNGADGILVPGGFGDRGVEGKIAAIKYARENKIPFLGICLGMQLASIEFARNVLGYKDAHSSELAPETKNPVITLLPEQEDVEDLGGTLRLGLYPCKIEEDTKAFEAYQDELIYERHRHRYEFNNHYRDEMMNKGFVFSGVSPDGRLAEIIELKDHPWFVASQFHPEFKSRPTKAHPLFRDFIGASLNHNEGKAE
jgi:CTP synthase